MSQLTVSTVPTESKSYLVPQDHPAGVPVWHEVCHEDAAGMQLMWTADAGGHAALCSMISVTACLYVPLSKANLKLCFR